MSFDFFVYFTSKGAGDIYIKAVCGLLSETYGIVDAKLFDPMTSNSGHWTIQSGLTPTYSSSGCTIGNLSSWKVMSVNQQFTSPVTMEFEIVSTTRGSYGCI